MTVSAGLAQIENISVRILRIRGERVIIDADLAGFYGVSTSRLNEQIRRNRDRFPADFIFQLNLAEMDQLIAKCDRFRRLKHSSVRPFALTEHGAIMAASVLNSARAVEVSVFIVRAFVQMRRVLTERRELVQQLAELERRLSEHDEQIIGIVGAIRSLLGEAPLPPRRAIGFRVCDQVGDPG